MAYIWDIVLVIAVMLCIRRSVKKGFLAASHNILALILTAVMLTSMQPTVLAFLQSSALGENVRQIVAENVLKGYEKEQLPEDTDTTDTEMSETICDSLGLPGFMKSGIKESISQMSEIKNNVMEVISDAISLAILKVISIIILFVLVKLIVFLALKFLESLFSLPGLRTMNQAMGACIGIINALLLVYIICGAVSLFTPTDKLPAVSETVSETYIVKYFYENNILMSLFI